MTEKEKNNMTGPADRILRLLYQEHAECDGAVREILEIFDEMDDQSNGDMVFTDVNGEWLRAAAM